MEMMGRVGRETLLNADCYQAAQGAFASKAFGDSRLVP